MLPDLEKIEKKYEIGLMREKDQIQSFIDRQRQDVDCAKTMLKQKKVEYLDRAKAKCQTIEGNLKQFKLKSRTTYQDLAEEEKQLDAELSALEDKFEGWATEAPSNNAPAASKRASSVSHRLYTAPNKDLA
jgi:hypothetical protein